jgi:fumarate reductase flavoprotein subunit
MSQENLLFSPFTFPGGSTLKNRLMMAPMTTCSGFHDGSVTEDVVDYYRQRAEGLGGVIVESCFIDKKGPAFPGALGIDDDDKIPGLARIASAIKERGAKAIVQIYHGGRMVDPALIGGQTPCGPSAIAAPREGACTPLALSADDVVLLVQQFAAAVRRSIQAGFDGVEIHGANTYLIQQFFSPHSNQRTDSWGGSREKRTAFARAILDAAHQQITQHTLCGEFIVGYRFSPEEIEEPGIRFADTMYLLETLAGHGLDYVHFSMGHFLRSSLCDAQDPTPLITRYCAERSARLAAIPTIGVGGIINLADAEAALAQGYDLAAVGKACIAYPDWVSRAEKQATLSLFIDSNQREALSIPLPLWRFAPVASMVCDASLLNKKYKPGLYREWVKEENHAVCVDVQLDKHGITDMMLESHQGFGPELPDCFSTLRERMLSANSPHVDAISGATTQCEQIKKAVIKALNKSVRAQQQDDGLSHERFPHYDVLVVGSGGGGMSAAIQASDSGARVILVDKMPSLGGNTFKASAGMNAAGTRFQRQKGIEDDKSLFFEETLKGGHYKNNVELLRYFVDQAPLAVEWLADRGIELNDLTTTGGMSVERTHRPPDGSSVGSYLIKGLVQNITRRPIDILTDTSVARIRLQQGAMHSVDIVTDGEEQQILARSIIVATGGFSANKAMITQYRPDLSHFVTTNHKGATGCGIRMLMEIGATTVDMEQIQTHPTVEQSTSYLISESIRGGGAILLASNGQRFVNEMATRDRVSEAIIRQKGGIAWLLFNEQIRQSNKSVEEYIRRGLVTLCDTIDALAQHLSIEPETLAHTLSRYNAFVESGLDEDFGRQTALRSQFLSGPYYLIRIAPGIHHTMGGVAINAETAVLNGDGEPIPGVYAAGEVVGGIHGANRIGGNAVADVIVFGVQAGKHAASYARTCQ